MIDPHNPETYRQAAGVIVERGLAKGDFVDGEGRVCLRGAFLALSVVIDGVSRIPRGGLDGSDVRCAQEVARTLGMRDWDYVVWWNNRLDTTAGDVIDALNRTAKRKEKERESTID